MSQLIPVVRESFWKRRVVTPFVAQLSQGVTPEKLALTVALGHVLGIFPILGSTTLLCGIAAAVLRLNQPAIQLVNYFAYPAQRGFRNLTVVTCDMNVFDIAAQFDRVVSVEMFEHMKNYQALLAKIARWLAPGGKLFVHIFTHRRYACHYGDKGPDDWMTRYFFAGGQMPSDDLLLYFQDDIRIEQHWCVSGTHYQKTAEAWLANMDANREEIWPLFEQTYGADKPKRWWTYWRVFFLACAELWGCRAGNEWHVSHYRFCKA